MLTLLEKGQAMYSRENRQAFTIVELLVVVAIIALLAGIMVPAVQKAMDAAKNTVVNTQFHAIEVGLELFRQDPRAGDGEYPEDAWIRPGSIHRLPGHVSLAIQLVGRDLRGYKPDDDYGSKSLRLEPFIKLDTVEFVDLNRSASNDPEPTMLCKWGDPILYFRAKPGTTAQDEIIDIYDYRAVRLQQK